MVGDDIEEWPKDGYIKEIPPTEELTKSISQMTYKSFCTGGRHTKLCFCFERNKYLPTSFLSTIF